MNNRNYHLGKKYICQPIGLKQKVVGEVISKLENCVVICVDEYHDVDRNEILEKKSIYFCEIQGVIGYGEVK
ncbi:hypothetical protein EfmAA290_17560 [Enterococcus faecium]|nr:hypothetical protein EfmAA290_17560 [Enterococcus faecium]